MILKNYFKLSPRLLTIAPTYRCTASCKNCCFGCTPKVEKVLETEKILNYINEAVSNFPSIKGVVFTGGECFLVGDEFSKLISQVTSHKLFSRVVSNAYWATSYETAVKRLTPLVNEGLKEINFSTGDNHQEFIPFENIINGLRAAYDLGIRSMCVSVESYSSAIFTSKEIQNHRFLAPMIAEGALFLINGAWMNFKNERKEEVLLNPFQRLEVHRPCKNLFENIFITPHSQMLACCGITVEYNPFLKLGSLEHKNMLDLYNSQFNDLFKFWLYVDGPAVIYDKITKLRGLKSESFPHECAYCLELVQNQNYIEILQDIINIELPGIIYRYTMRNIELNLFL